MSSNAYREALSRVLDLTPEEQLQLLEDVISRVRLRVTARRKHSVMELKGLGKEIWEGINVEKYIEEERNSWDR
jgi:hypothetical protein